MEMAVFTFQLKTFQSFSLSLSLTILVLLSSPTLKTLEEPSWATLPGNFLFIEVLPALASRNLEICWAFPKVLPFPTVPLPALHLSILRKKRFISNPKCWNLKLRAGVSIIFKIWVFYKARLERFEFSIGWPYAVYHEMQVVFYKKCKFYVFQLFVKYKQCFCQL